MPKKRFKKRQAILETKKMHTITGAKRVNKIIILNKFMPINFKIEQIPILNLSN